MVHTLVWLPGLSLVNAHVYMRLCLTWMSIFPRETKGVLSSVRNKQPTKKSPWSFLKNCETDKQSGSSVSKQTWAWKQAQLMFKDNSHTCDSRRGDDTRGEISGFKKVGSGEATILIFEFEQKQKYSVCLILICLTSFIRTIISIMYSFPYNITEL